MHQIECVDVDIGISNGSKQCKTIVPMRLIESLDPYFPLDSMTSLNIGHQQGPSPNTTSQDVRKLLS